MIENEMRKRAESLANYLKELEKLKKRKPVYDLANYEAVLWSTDIPTKQGYRNFSWDPASPDIEQNEVIVTRENAPEVPEPPDNVIPWVNRDSLRDVSLAQKLFSECVKKQKNGDEIILKLEDHRDVQDLWKSYLRTQWEPWKKKYQEWQQRNNIYKKVSLLSKIALD